MVGRLHCFEIVLFVASSGTDFTNGLYVQNLSLLNLHVFLLHEQQWCNQATILHMPRQPSCHGMCKSVTWSDPRGLKQDCCKINLHKILVMSSFSICAMGVRRPWTFIDQGSLTTFHSPAPVFLCCYVPVVVSGLFLGLHPAYERRRYFVTTSLIGWAHPRISPVVWSHHDKFCHQQKESRKYDTKINEDWKHFLKIKWINENWNSQ